MLSKCSPLFVHSLGSSEGQARPGMEILDMLDRAV